MDAAVISAVISFGMGTVLGTYLKIRWERSNSAQLQKQEYKTTRYKAISLLMYSLLDFDKNKPMLQKHGRHFADAGDLVDELKTEWNNMLLYASDEALKAVQDFIKKPGQESFRRGALAIRKDLWGGKVSLKIEDITL
ncbi:MAG TPA: hypothetical protein VGR89_14750 [Puia sp.]|nr:hypothetical protein [Puia sp.]